MKRALVLAAILALGVPGTAQATTPPPTPSRAKIIAAYPGQALPADWNQDSTWIGVVFSDAGYTGARLNLYLTGAPSCSDFNKAPLEFWFDTTGQTGHLKAYSSYWWAWHASSFGSTGKANCNRSRAWSARSATRYQDGNPASIPNFGIANDGLLMLQIGRVG